MSKSEFMYSQNQTAEENLAAIICQMEGHENRKKIQLSEK